MSDVIEYLPGEPFPGKIGRTIENIIGGGNVVCKKGSLARVDLSHTGELSGELVWLIPPKALALE